VTVSIDAVPDLEPEIATACFRVAQEALTNVLRHAGARRVWLELQLGADALELVVRDDGRGFDAVEARRRASLGASLGLLGMQERVTLSGGEFALRTPAGGGTEVLARFPLRVSRRRPA
jgi:signal transduction histidine kinase